MKNGRYSLVVAPPGYPGLRYRGRYCYEHIRNFWLGTGRVPGPGEVIHHVDGNPANNDISNLALLDSRAHSRLHARPKTINTWRCENCGCEFQRRANGKINHFCSRRCAGVFSFTKR